MVYGKGLVGLAPENPPSLTTTLWLMEATVMEVTEPTEPPPLPGAL